MAILQYDKQLSILGCLIISFSQNEMSLAADWPKHVIHENAKGQINGVSANDFDRDGEIDVISSFDGNVVLFKGPDWSPSSVHTFQPGQARNRPRDACIHSCLLDVDGDGDEDFVGSNNTVFWLEVPANPFSKKPWTYRTVDDEILGTHCLITGDVNLDGKLDLIANSGRDEKQTSLPNSITWLETPSKPKSATSWIRHVFANKNAPGGSHYMGFGDVNQDGRPDIACAAKGTDGFVNGQWFAWWEQPTDPNSEWTKHLLAENELGASNILPSDLNEDGHTDFLASRGHGKGVLWFQGPTFEKREIDPLIEYPHSLALADIDQDGHQDAITCGKEANGMAAWYKNNGKGQFTKHVIGQNQGSYDTRVVDMDKDGDLDILIAGHASRNIVWFENTLKSHN